MSFRSGFVVFLITALTLILVAQSVLAVAPSPKALEKWKAEGVLDEKLVNWRAFKEAGGCSPSVHPIWDKNRYAAKAALNANAVDTQNVLVLLVEFPDTQFSLPDLAIKNAFDSILFSDKLVGGKVNPTGSMVDFYRENSFGKVYIHGTVVGPYTASQNYSYYVSSDDGFSHSPGLVREVLTLADGDVNFANYAISGSVPSVVVVHCGVGAEGGGTGIWSHKSSVGSINLDGVTFEDYTMNPELIAPGMLSSIGVFCHEYGHVLGLPDLYDTQYHAGSNGMGDWSLMASGNYNGLNTGESPSDLDAWCKIQLGFIPLDSIQMVGANLANVAIPAAEFTPKAFLIADSFFTISGIQYYSTEYFLVENRQFLGSDVGLPGSGLVIYHVDRGVNGNNDPTRYQVAVVQADGLNQLATPPGNRGDAGDSWPGATDARHLDNFSTPNTKLNIGAKISEVGVWNISNSDSIMYANLDYTYSHPYLVLAGADSLQFLDTSASSNNDSIIEPGEVVTFYCKIQNYMKQAYNWSVSLSCDNPDVQFLSNGVAQGPNNLLNPAQGIRKSDSAVILQLAPNGQSSYATFTLTITADSAFHSGDRKYSSTYTFKKMIGTPQLLLVDDDNGAAYEQRFVTMFQRMGLPYRLWTKANGSPSASDLIAGRNVFWMGGAVPNGVLTTADVTAMKGLLDAGGNLCMAMTGGVGQLQALDSTFLHGYFHAQALDSAKAKYFFGEVGNPVTGGGKFDFASSIPANNLWCRKLSGINGGQNSLKGSTSVTGATTIGNVGVTYNSGTYKTVIQSVPIEFLSSSDTTNGFLIPDSVFLRILGYFEGNATGVNDGDNPNLPGKFALSQNYPNPFNPSTVISYTIPTATVGTSARLRTELVVFNLLGQKVRTLVSIEQGPGNYSVTWDGSSDSGTKVTSGVYFYRLTHGEFRDAKKMVLLK